MNKIIYGVLGLIVIIGGGIFLAKFPDKNKDIEIAFADVTVLNKSVSVGADQNNLKEIEGDTESVSTGSYLKTGENGRALISLGKAQTSVDYNSLVTIEDKTDQGSIINLQSGKTWSRVEKLLDKGEYHEIKTKNAVASVRGTSFGFYVDGDITTLVVASGTVKFIPLDKNGKEQPQFAIYVTEGKKAIRDGFLVTKIDDINEGDKDSFFKQNHDEYQKVMDEQNIEEEEKKDESVVPKEEYKNIEDDTTPPDEPAPAPAKVDTTTVAPKTETKTTSSSGGGSASNVVGLYLTSISPNVVDVGSGETVNFIGGGFSSATTLIINETSISFKVVNDNKITIIAGEELPQGIYDVTIVDKSKQETTLPKAFEVKELGKAQNEADVR